MITGPRRARAPAVAGTFYPGERDRLASLVDGLLDAATVARAGAPVALIAPHAGYTYSGAVAAAAYARLRHGGLPRQRIAIAGPAHYVRLRGAAVPVTLVWDTPLGPVRIDEDLRDLAIRLGAVADDGPHAPEHAVEVQLPFLQRVVRAGLTVLPIAVDDMTPAAAADLLGRVRDAADLLVVSTDLSHYQPDAIARRWDRRTVEAIVATDPDAIGPDAACGIFALRGVVELARQRRLAVELLDLRTSADAGGDPSRVVGYVAMTIG